MGGWNPGETITRTVGAAAGAPGALAGSIPGGVGDVIQGGLDRLGGTNPLKKTIDHYNQPDLPPVTYTPYTSHGYNPVQNTYQPFNQSSGDPDRYKAPTLDKVNFANAIQQQMAQNPSIAGGNAAASAQLAAALGNRSNTAYGQQQGLVNQLQQESAGQGPGASLAQNMLNQATQQNIQQGAGLIASTKGLNPALAARMAADQSAQMNQQAAMQGANLGFQQQLAARQQLGGLLGNEQALATGTGANLLSTGAGQDITAGLGLGSLNQQRLSSEIGGNQGQNALTSEGTLATNKLGAELGMHRAEMGERAQELGARIAGQNADAGTEANRFGAGAYNTAAGAGAAGTTGAQVSTNEGALGVGKINSGISQHNADTQGKIVGGIASGLGPLAGLAGLGKGGGAAAGGAEGATTAGVDTSAMSGIGTMVSQGGRIGGKANVRGDSPQNDTVKALLSPGEIVIPRSHSHSPEAAKSFIDALMHSGSRPKGYGAVLQAKKKAASAKNKKADGGWILPDDGDPMPPERPQPIAGAYADGGEVEEPDPTAAGADDDSAGEADQPSDEIKPDANGKVSIMQAPQYIAQQAGKAGSSVMDWLISKGSGGPGTATSSDKPSAPAADVDHVTALGNANTDNPRFQLASTQPPADQGTQNDQTMMPPSEDSFFKEQEQALRTGADARQGAIGGITNSWDEYKTASDKADRKLADDTAQIEAERKQLMQSYMEGKIDPNRLWNDAGTGGHIMAGIGLVLSGIGSGLTGQPNLAAQVIEKAIDRDIESQRADLGKKQTLLSENVRRYGNIQEAYNATKSQLHTAAMAEVSKYQAMAQSGATQQQLQMGLSELGMKRDQYDFQRQMLSQINNSPTPPTGVNTNKAQALLSAYSPLTKEQKDSLQKEIDEYGHLSNQLNDVDSTFDQIAKLQTFAKRANPLTARDTYRQIEQLRDSHAYSWAKDIENKVTEGDVAANKENIQTFLDSPETAANGKGNIENIVRSKHGSFSTMRSLGVVNPNDPVIAPSGAAKQKKDRNVQLISGAR